MKSLEELLIKSIEEFPMEYIKKTSDGILRETRDVIPTRTPGGILKSSSNTKARRTCDGIPVGTPVKIYSKTADGIPKRILTSL